MRYCAVLYLSMTLTAAADSTLHDALKTNPAFPSQQSGTYDFSPEQSPPLEDTSSQSFHPLNDEEGKDYLPQTIIVNDELPSHYRAVVEDTLYLQLIMLSSIGVLALMPESVTSWDQDELRKDSLSSRWKKNVSSRPVWDKDDWIINYIGHPVSGAWYYTMGRNDGLSIGESAAFSALMSTFVWEYGYEAFAEVPSIQDLIITPLFGSILGEGMIILQGRLDENGGVVFGSRSLGNISYFFLDPLGNIAHGMRNILKSFNIDADVTVTIQSYPYAMPQLRLSPPFEDSIRYRERELGFIITFQ